MGAIGLAFRETNRAHGALPRDLHDARGVRPSA